MEDIKRKATSTKLAGGIALAWFLVEQQQALLAVIVYAVYAASEIAEKIIKARRGA